MTYLRIRGVDLYSEITGTGEPVLLLHGGFCSLESLRPQAEALAPRYRVHAYERPGHGRSADIDDDYDYDRAVADALEYLDAQELERVHIVGYSDGAIIGLLLAMRHPERVSSLVAISANLDPTAFTFSDVATGLVLPPLPVDPDAAEPPDLERRHYDRLSPDGPAHGEVVLGKLFRLWTTEPHIDPGDLGALAAPTLVMAADRDTIRLDHSQLIAASIPGAQLCIVPGTSHGLVNEKPEVIGILISDFLAGLVR